MPSDLARSNLVFTKISLPSSVTKVGTSDDLREIKGRRILWIDLKRVVKGEPSLKAEISLVENIRQFVRQDIQASPLERIDSVRFDAEYPNEPTSEMWQALDGLSPKHLEVRARGPEEECDILSLNTLRYQWKDLESVSLQGMCCGNLDEVPQIFSQISSLELVYCHSLTFIPPPNGVTALKHLRISKNNAFDMFIAAFDGNPSFRQTLETLDIESLDPICDFQQTSGPRHFRNRLNLCTRLRKLRLSIAHYVDSEDDIDELEDDVDSDLDLASRDGYLASSIPPSVEQLELRFMRSLPFLHDMDEWTSQASDVNWLPLLKSFRLNIDSSSPFTAQSSQKPWASKNEKPPTREVSLESFESEFEKKRQILYGVLASTRPWIELTV